MPQLKTSGKAFYILLCAILGMMLFVVIQRALALIYYLLLDTSFKTYSFGLDYYQLSWINWITALVAVLGGLWYGIWLGLHWYETVYEEGTGGVWQHIKKHLPHRQDFVKSKVPAAVSAPSVAKPAAPASSSNSVTIKPTVRTSDRHWDLDDLLKKDEVIEAAVQAVSKPKKKAVKRKPAAKKSTATDTTAAI